MAPRQHVRLLVVKMFMAVVVMSAFCMPMVMLMALLIVLVVTMHVIMPFDAGGGFVFNPERENCLQQSAPFDPHQPGTQKRDETVTDDLDHAHGVTHELCGCSENNGGNADDRNGRQCLHNGGCERQRDTAAPGLPVGK